MKKILVCLSLILIALSVFPNTLSAEEDKKEYDVVFDGEKIVYYFYEEDGSKTLIENEEDLVLDLSDFQPDDSILRIYHLVNNSGDSIDWYMHNISEDIFENSDDSSESSDDTSESSDETPRIVQDATYTYSLTYSAYAPAEDGKTIYFSNVVGGELVGDHVDNIPKGIGEATEGLEGYFLIHEGYSSGDAETAEMSLLVDGVSSAFVYQNTDATVKIGFGVVVPPSPINKHEEKIIYIPYTGDTININFYIIAEVLSLLLLAIVLYAYYRYLKRQKEA